MPPTPTVTILLFEAHACVMFKHVALIYCTLMPSDILFFGLVIFILSCRLLLLGRPEPTDVGRYCKPTTADPSVVQGRIWPAGH